jgi:hypothetical protein
MYRIALTERETSLLLEVSDGRSVPLSFSSRVWLKADPTHWAAVLLNEWRGGLVEGGAGI